MSNSEHNEVDGTMPDEGKLQQFERNRFFNGKLMTARDMQTEQDYHRGRFDTLTQHVTGEGVVCGLEVEIEPAEGNSDTPTAVVGPGLAFDSSGRPLIVADDTPEEIPADKLGGNGVSVFIEYATCKAESVPVPGSEDACKEECDYNRLREQVDVTFERGPPDEQKSVPIDRVHTIPRDDDNFPPDETEDGEFEPIGDVLKELARTYNLPREDDPDELRYRRCDAAGNRAVFIGYFTEDDGSWSPDDSELRPHVYTNDMLYAGLADHAFDLDNPHYTSLEVSDLDTGATVRTEETEDVTLTSSDGSVSITANADERTLDLTGVGGRLEVSDLDNGATIRIEGTEDVTLTSSDGSVSITANADERTLDLTGMGGTGLGPFEPYLPERAIRCIACTFKELKDVEEDQFDEAGRIAEAALGQLKHEDLQGTPVYENPAEFVRFVEDKLMPGMTTLQNEIHGDVVNVAGIEQDYDRGLDLLMSATEGEDPVEVAIALHRMCKIARCLVTYYTPGVF